MRCAGVRLRAAVQQQPDDAVVSAPGVVRDDAVEQGGVSTECVGIDAARTLGSMPRSKPPHDLEPLVIGGHVQQRSAIERGADQREGMVVVAAELGRKELHVRESRLKELRILLQPPIQQIHATATDAHRQRLWQQCHAPRGFRGSDACRRGGAHTSPAPARRANASRRSRLRLGTHVEAPRVIIGQGECRQYRFSRELTGGSDCIK